jgi:rhodanese-related sulfurtransferase
LPLQEFQAGHIKGAINYEVSTLQDPKVLDDLVKEVASADKVVVHCQLSLKRGPTAAALLVERLNQLADKKPELAVLRGGFEEFGSKFQDDPSLVEGSGTASAVNGKH